MNYNAMSLVMLYLAVFCFNVVFHHDIATAATQVEQSQSTVVVVSSENEDAVGLATTQPPPLLATTQQPMTGAAYTQPDLRTVAHRTVARSIEDFDDDVDYTLQQEKEPKQALLPPGPTIERLRSAEHMLHSALFAPGRYQKNVRPLADHGRSIKVRLGVCVMTIDEIIEKDQTMITSGCVKMKWNDEFLQWAPEDFKNLSWMALPSTDIWIPDIALINSPDPYYITRKPAFSEVAHTGDVGYYPSGRFSTRCQISLTYFPFDWQKCELRFESWVYPVQWLYMEAWQPEPVDMKDYYRNHQWDLDRFSVTPGNVTYDGLAFSSIRFSFYFRRRTLYYCVLSIFPCLIMSVLQMFSHTLPVEHPARMTLLTSLFVSSSVIQSSLASQMPKSSDGVSLIQLYLMIFSTNLLISMLITSMNMHVWFRVPVSVIPTMSRMLRAYFLDTGKPQQLHPAIAAPIAVSEAPQPPQSADSRPRKGSSSLLRKIGRKMNWGRNNKHTHPQQHPPRRGVDDEAAIAMVEQAKPASSSSPTAQRDIVVELVADSSALESSPVWELNRAQAMLSSPISPSYSSDTSIEAEYHLEGEEVKTKKTSGGCCCLRRRRGALKKAAPGRSSVADTPPAKRDTQQQPPSNLAERKDKWLQYSMLIDKVFLYAMFVYNLLCPIVIFGLVPQIQMFYMDDDADSVYFDPANYYSSNK